MYSKKQNTRYHTDLTRVSKNVPFIIKQEHVAFFAVFLACLNVFPLVAHAALFSGIFSNAEAQTLPSKGHIQSMPLPDPNLDVFSANKKIAQTHADVSLTQGLLEPVVGPLGTSVEAEDYTGSDTISVYTVHPGDTVSKIAKLFDVTENTVRWANNLKKNESPKVGDVLVILPVDGISYVVKKGDTLKSIARKYGADAEEIGAFNGLELESELAYGETIIIPDGEIAEPKPKEVPKKKVTKVIAGATKIIKSWSKDIKGYFMRPVRGGIRTQGVHGYNGVDIGAPTGTSVYAAADATVLIAKTGGYNTGYGNYIILSHPNGTQTLYAHLSRVDVSAGQRVSQGEQIGAVGSTGKSTGPHLHFEVRGAANPLGADARYGL